MVDAEEALGAFAFGNHVDTLRGVRVHKLAARVVVGAMTTRPRGVLGGWQENGQRQEPGAHHNDNNEQRHLEPRRRSAFRNSAARAPATAFSHARVASAARVDDQCRGDGCCGGYQHRVCAVVPGVRFFVGRRFRAVRVPGELDSTARRQRRRQRRRRRCGAAARRHSDSSGCAGTTGTRLPTSFLLRPSQESFI